MKYEVLIYAGSEVFSALNVDGENMQYISMSGNTEHPADDVSGFYEHLLDYYNVDDLSEIKAGIRIINGGAVKKNIEFLFKKFGKVDDLSIWRVEKLIPVMLINKNMLDKDQRIGVRVYERCYAVEADKDFNVSVSVSDNAESELTLEDFTLFNNFNGADLKQDTELIDRLMMKISGLESENDKNLNVIKELQNRIAVISNEKTAFQAELDKFIVKRNYSVGNTIEFGRYNGKTIKWRILKQNNGSVYVLCEEILCSQIFASSNSNVWANSDLRKWLNGEFYNNAFNDEEKEQIISTDGDNITLLTKEEAESLLSKEERAAGSWWWLRSPLPNRSRLVWLVRGGGAFGYGTAGNICGVRPAFNLKF